MRLFFSPSFVVGGCLFLSVSSSFAASVFTATSITSGAKNWVAAGCSANGQFVSALPYAEPLFYSQNGGANWQEARLGACRWDDLAVSADGRYMLVSEQYGAVYVTSNSGQNWAQANLPTQNWHGVDSSADGRCLAACVDNGGIYLSSDSGSHWREVIPGGVPRHWTAIAMSSDGQNIVACWHHRIVLSGQWYSSGQLYTSDDGGNTWTQRCPELGDKYWTTVAVSPDGRAMLAAISDYRDGVITASVYISVDNGHHWFQTQLNNQYYWISGAITAADGLWAICANDGYVYLSENYGITWQAQEALGRKSWVDVRVSSDGNRIIAAAYGDKIYRLTKVEDNFPWELFSGCWLPRHRAATNGFEKH